LTRSASGIYTAHLRTGSAGRANPRFRLIERPVTGVWFAIAVDARVDWSSVQIHFSRCERDQSARATSGRSRTRTWDLFLISVRRARDVGAVAGMVVTKYLLIGGCGKTVVTLTARRGSADVPVSYRRATTAWW
jgi:hypothetical protein